jgi:hypothetical protein
VGYQDEVKLLSRFVVSYGTHLDNILGLLIGDVLHLMKAANENVKQEYVALSANVVHNMGELIRSIDSLWKKEGDSATKSKSNSLRSKPNGTFGDISLLSNGMTVQQLRELCKKLRAEDVKNMTLATRLACGIWPPPSAIPQMINSAISLTKACKLLVDLANSTGHWPPSESPRQLDRVRLRVILLDSTVECYAGTLCSSPAAASFSLL